MGWFSDKDVYLAFMALTLSGLWCGTIWLWRWIFDLIEKSEK